MNIMTFNYNKEGTISERVFVPITHPTDKYFGIDITELDIEDQVAFDEEYFKLQDELKGKTDELMEKYDIKFKYRSFLPSKMTNIVFEE